MDAGRGPGRSSLSATEPEHHAVPVGRRDRGRSDVDKSIGAQGGRCCVGGGDRGPVLLGVIPGGTRGPLRFGCPITGTTQRPEESVMGVEGVAVPGATASHTKIGG